MPAGGRVESARLAELPPGAAESQREYTVGDYLILYTLRDATAFLLLISRHRKLSFDFSRLWQDRLTGIVADELGGPRRGNTFRDSRSISPLILL